MNLIRLPRLVAVGILVLFACEANPPPQAPVAQPAPPPVEDEAAVRAQARGWRSQHLIIDLHEHVDATPEHLKEAVLIQDAVGIGLAVNLSGGYVTHARGAPSELQRVKE